MANCLSSVLVLRAKIWSKWTCTALPVGFQPYQSPHLTTCGRREDLRCILPLPQPASLSEAEIALRNLVETTQHVDRVQHLWTEAGQKVWEWLVVAGVSYMYLRHGTNTPREKAQHFRPAQQADVDLATKLKRIRLDYHGDDHGQFHAMEI